MKEALLESNLRWAAAQIRSDPDYFRTIAGAGLPRLFWIGCCDSHIPAHTLIGLSPGQVCEYRSLANMALGGDLAFAAALQHAVEALRVEQVVVCGHYTCAAIRASLDDPGYSVFDHWSEPLHALARRHEATLAAVADADARANVLSELNVAGQVAQIARNPIVRMARKRGQKLSVHGVMLSHQDGLLRDLGLSAASQSGA